MTVSDANRCRSLGPEASRASFARKVTAFTRRNGIGMQKYCVYTGVGTRLTSRSETAVVDASDGHSRERASDTQDTRFSTKMTRNWKLVTPSALLIASSCSRSTAPRSGEQRTELKNQTKIV